MGVNVALISWVPSATHCQHECQKNDQCLYFTFVTTDGRCVLKSLRGTKYGDYAISGPKFCSTGNGWLKYSYFRGVFSLHTILFTITMLVAEMLSPQQYQMTMKLSNCQIVN
jgi:hypothetical protein